MKKFKAFLWGLVFCISAALLYHTPVQAEEDLDYVLGRPMTEEEIEEQKKIHEEALANNGYVAPPEPDEPADISLTLKDLRYRGVIPAKYDSRDLGIVPAIRNQNPYGTCWAHASIACAEIDLIKSGYADKSINLSEAHLIYYSNNEAPDPLGNSYNDAIANVSSKGILDSGGNEQMTYGALASWKGAVPETIAKYPSALTGNELSKTTEQAYGYDVAHLQGYYSIPSNDRDVIKSAILTHGAVGASYYDGYEQYFNYNTAAYYCDNASLGTNHEVTIIGWDDSYSKENFYSWRQPKEDGAWLVRNSWGASWGKAGYFWMSYEEATLGSLFAFDMEPADNYDNNYQYDFSSTAVGSTVSATGVASVFEAKANEGKAEELKAVAIAFAQQTNVKYSLQIYLNPTNKSNPTSGTPVFDTPQTGITTFAGYYTIPLKESVTLNQGDIFAVVFTFDENINVSLERSYSSSGYFLSTTASAKENESYFLYSNYWFDSGERYNANTRIKAFTDNVNENLVACTGVQLNVSELQLEKGDAEVLAATVQPSNASNKKVIWSSSNEFVADVDQAGKVTAVGSGSATITVTTMDGGYKATCEVEVKLPIVPVTGVTLSMYSLKLEKGTTRTVVAMILPADATNKNVTWSSDNPSVASVDKNGRITALSKGYANISAQTVDGGYTESCLVEVVIPVTSVDFDYGTYLPDQWGYRHLVKNVTILPAEAADTDLTWSSSDPDVVHVNQEGTLTFLKEGTAVIRATAPNGVYKEVTIDSAIKVVNGISLNKQQLALVPGNSEKLYATVSPDTAINKKVIWSSDDPSVASVDSDGTVTARKAGIADITASTQDGNYKAFATVVVTENIPVTSIDFDYGTYLPYRWGYEHGVNRLTVLPENATDKTITWSSSAPDVVSVSQEGIITFHKEGTAVIRAAATSGVYKEVTIESAIRVVTGIRLNKEELRLAKGNSETLIATVTPSTALNKTVNWMSDNSSIVSVDENGNITAHNEGVATIWARSEDGGYEAGCRVEVYVPVTGVTLDVSELELNIGEVYSLAATVLPANATNPNVSWGSSDASVVIVDELGNVTAVESGAATVFVKTEDGEYTDFCNVRVTEPASDDPDEPNDPEKTNICKDSVYRVYGQNRYATSFRIADALKANRDGEAFDTIIVANGKGFADALAGSYLAAVKEAPILMSSGSNAADIQNYIRSNVNPGGMVYLLGGVNAVPESVGSGLNGYIVKRLWGNNRYDTNLEILREAGVEGQEILVCTGTGFADSLSASAAKKPILLVGKTLSAAQRAYLSGLSGNRFCIIGGTSAVSASVEAEIASYGSATRIGGANRYETSVLIAEAFFDDIDTIVLAYARNYPDGLCGGPFAMSMEAPLILTATGQETVAGAYAGRNGIVQGAVLGGPGLISDEAVRNVFGPTNSADIITW